MADLLDQFVCVRIVQCWGMDLSLFEFDGSLTWAVTFLNADRTIYGRYGSRSSRQGGKDVSIEGFRAAMKGALETHKNVERYRKLLAAYTPPSPRWKTPEKIPQMLGRVVRADGSRAGCIHCHAMHTATMRNLRKDGHAIPDRMLWNYPMPDAAGIHLNVKAATEVTRVAPESPAKKAGIQSGDHIRKMNGVPVHSIADVQWFLHRAPEPGKIETEVERNGKNVKLMLNLPKGWRRNGDFGWREYSWFFRNAAAGFNSKPLPSEARKRLGIKNGEMALRIERLSPGFVKHRNPAAANIGLRKNDVIVAVDGKNSFSRESDFLAYLIQATRPGERVRLTVVRGDQRREFMLPVP